MLPIDYRVPIVIVIPWHFHGTVAAVHQGYERLRVLVLKCRVLLANATRVTQRRVLLALFVSRELVDLIQFVRARRLRLPVHDGALPI